MEENKELTSHERKELKRLQREQEKTSHQEQTEGLHKKSKAKKVILWCAIAIIIIGGLYFYGSYQGKKPGKFDSLASCLSEKGVVMYGTEWCPNCQAQKKAFGKSFSLINYVDCDLSNLCDQKGVTGYPTWISPDDKRLVGRQELDVLAKTYGCPLQ